MLFTINKTTLLKFLNKKHCFLTRLGFGVIGFLITFLLFKDFIIARQSYHDFLKDNFKTATRRAGWVLYRTTGKQIIYDGMYDFTQGIEVLGLRRLEKVLLRQREKNPTNETVHSDLIFVWSAMLEINAGNSYTNIKNIEVVANNIISNLATLQHRLSVSNSNMESSLNTKEAKKALHDFSKLFPLKDFPWYVVSGTFLGLIREKCFLKHDCDIDIGFHSEHFNMSRFLEKLQGNDLFFVAHIDYQNQFSISDEIIKHETRKIVELKLIHTTGLNIDIFIHHLENNIRWHGSPMHRWENKNFQLTKYQLEGIEVFGPKNYDEYLTENYGAWRIPVKKFHSSTGTPNLKIAPNFISIALLFKRIHYSPTVESFEYHINILDTAGLINKSGQFHFSDNWSSYKHT